jgi:membrane protease YdiL (CAAX protease family)
MKLVSAHGWAGAALVAAAFAAAAAATAEHAASTARVLVLLVAAPLLEEAIFRAGLQEWMIRSRHSAARCIGVTAVVFAAAHALARPEAMTLTLLLPGVLLGMLYQRTRSVVACAALHAAMNGFWLAFMAR